MGIPIAQISKAVDGVMSQQLLGLRDHLGAMEGDAEKAPDEAKVDEDAPGDFEKAFETPEEPAEKAPATDE